MTTLNEFLDALAGELGVPRENVQWLVNWIPFESGHGDAAVRYNNPLNTTLAVPGSIHTPVAGTPNWQIYPTAAIGAAATAKTLTFYPAIMDALKTGVVDPAKLAPDLRMWLTGDPNSQQENAKEYVAKIASALGQPPSVPMPAPPPPVVPADFAGMPADQARVPAPSPDVSAASAPAAPATGPMDPSTFVPQPASDSPARTDQLWNSGTQRTEDQWGNWWDENAQSWRSPGETPSLGNVAFRGDYFGPGGQVAPPAAAPDTSTGNLPQFGLGLGDLQPAGPTWSDELGGWDDGLGHVFRNDKWENLSGGMFGLAGGGEVDAYGNVVRNQQEPMTPGRNPNGTVGVNPPGPPTGTPNWAAAALAQLQAYRSRLKAPTGADEELGLSYGEAMQAYLEEYMQLAAQEAQLGDLASGFMTLDDGTVIPTADASPEQRARIESSILSRTQQLLRQYQGDANATANADYSNRLAALQQKVAIGSQSRASAEAQVKRMTDGLSESRGRSDLITTAKLNAAPYAAIGDRITIDPYSIMEAYDTEFGVQGEIPRVADFPLSLDDVPQPPSLAAPSMPDYSSLRQPVAPALLLDEATPQWEREGLTPGQALNRPTGQAGPDVGGGGTPGTPAGVVATSPSSPESKAIDSKIAGMLALLRFYGHGPTDATKAALTQGRKKPAPAKRTPDPVMRGR